MAPSPKPAAKQPHPYYHPQHPLPTSPPTPSQSLYPLPSAAVSPSLRHIQPVNSHSPSPSPRLKHALPFPSAAQSGSSYTASPSLTPVQSDAPLPHPSNSNPLSNTSSGNNSRSGSGRGSPALGYAGLPRSRRSSAALATSVSLASRERSRTPVQRLISPTLSPDRNRDSNGSFGMVGSGRPSLLDTAGRRSKRSSIEYSSMLVNPQPSVVDVVQEEGTDPDETSANIDDRLLISKIKGKGRMHGGNVFEFADFGWEEAFEDDDEEAARDLDSEVDRTSMLMDGLGVTSAGDDPGTGRHSSSGRTSLYQRLKVSRPGSRKSSYGRISPDDSLGDDKDVFRPGERFAAGLPLRGEIVEIVDPTSRLHNRAVSREMIPSLPTGAESSTANMMFEVVRKLGSGSYANVYLVREVGGVGQEYALKCLSKRDLEQDSLDVQLFEATIHVCLPKHENIVTLYQTLQTRKWLFLLMEMCPGEDLFYWLEHSRDSPPDSAGAESDSPPATDSIAVPDGRHLPPLSSSQLPSSAIPYSSSAILSGMAGSQSSLALSHSPAFAFSKSHLAHEIYHNGHAGTPTTPSLLAAYSAKALLSPRRLKLIASMFGQMCEAVALCHDAGVSHRDIKPENFICCDSTELAATREDDEIARYEKRKVIVKLTDFGLATMEENSLDVECGSRPYMAYECRNELGPSYAPRPADVWSLGVVLLNMLFHRNPWTDPTPGNKNFDGFLDDPVDFLLTRFTGIGREVATYLAYRVFALNVEQRVSAREFGVWSKDLPAMIGGRKAITALKFSHLDNGPSGKDSIDFAKSPIHPKGMGSSLAGTASNLTQSAPPHQAPTSGHQQRPEAARTNEEPQDNDLRVTEAPVETDSAIKPSGAASDQPPTDQQENEDDDDDAMDDSGKSIAPSGKRKKRGVRKGKAAKAAAKALLAGIDTAPPRIPCQTQPTDEVIAGLAEASEHLAREASNIHKSKFVVDLDEFPKIGEQPVVEVKKSRWRALITSSSGNPELQALARKVREKDAAGMQQSAPARLQQPTVSTVDRGSVLSTPSLSQVASINSGASRSPSRQSSRLEADTWRPINPERGRTLDSALSQRSDGSPIPSLTHSRATSMYTASVYSLQTVQTRTSVATADSFSSTQSGQRLSSAKPKPPVPKTNVKVMTGIPWELDELPRQARMDRNGDMPQGDIFSKPPARRTKASQLAPIDETVPQANPFSPITKTTSVSSQRSIQSSKSSLFAPSSLSASSPPTKLKAQISNFGKMLGGFKTRKEV